MNGVDFQAGDLVKSKLDPRRVFRVERVDENGQYDLSWHAWPEHLDLFCTQGARLLLPLPGWKLEKA